MNSEKLFFTNLLVLFLPLPLFFNKQEKAVLLVNEKLKSSRHFFQPERKAIDFEATVEAGVEKAESF